MTFLRSLAHTLAFYIGGAPLVVLAAMAALLGRNPLDRAARLWAQYHYWCVRVLLGIEVVIEGRFPTAAAIIAMKHESALETIEVLRIIDRPAVVLKAELLSIPVWGFVARRHGSIPVAREAGAAALRTMLKAARQAIAEDRPIVIFPEGTRVPHGTRPPLRPGISALYKSLGVPVVPVALDSGRLWQRRKFLKRPGRVTIRVGEAIPPGGDRDGVERRVHDGINALNQ